MLSLIPSYTGQYHEHKTKIQKRCYAVTCILSSCQHTLGPVSHGFHAQLWFHTSHQSQFAMPDNFFLTSSGGGQCATLTDYILIPKPMLCVRLRSLVHSGSSRSAPELAWLPLPAAALSRAVPRTMARLHPDRGSPSAGSSVGANRGAGGRSELAPAAHPLRSLKAHEPV